MLTVEEKRDILDLMKIGKCEFLLKLSENPQKYEHAKIAAEREYIDSLIYKVQKFL